MPPPPPSPCPPRVLLPRRGVERSRMHVYVGPLLAPGFLAAVGSRVYGRSWLLDPWSLLALWLRMGLGSLAALGFVVLGRSWFLGPWLPPGLGSGPRLFLGLGSAAALASLVLGGSLLEGVSPCLALWSWLLDPGRLLALGSLVARGSWGLGRYWLCGPWLLLSLEPLAGPCSWALVLWVLGRFGLSGPCSLGSRPSPALGHLFFGFLAIPSSWDLGFSWLCAPWPPVALGFLALWFLAVLGSWP